MNESDSGRAQLEPVVLKFIEQAGTMAQSAGVGRVLGQIYAYLYFSPEARNLSDLQQALGISKGSASTGVRQLEQWGAVKKIWVKGDRRNYYEAVDWFGKILRNAVLDTVGKRIAAYTSFLSEAEAELADQSSLNGEQEFLRERVADLRRFHGRLEALWSAPLVKRLLGL